jgi:hypothetical protein
VDRPVLIFSPRPAKHPVIGKHFKECLQIGAAYRRRWFVAGELSLFSSPARG